MTFVRRNFRRLTTLWLAASALAAAVGPSVALAGPIGLCVDAVFETAFGRFTPESLLELMRNWEQVPEKQRSDLSRAIDGMTSRLRDSGRAVVIKQRGKIVGVFRAPVVDGWADTTGGEIYDPETIELAVEPLSPEEAQRLNVENWDLTALHHFQRKLVTLRSYPQYLRAWVQPPAGVSIERWEFDEGLCQGDETAEHFIKGYGFKPHGEPRGEGALSDHAIRMDGREFVERFGSAYRDWRARNAGSPGIQWEPAAKTRPLGAAANAGGGDALLGKVEKHNAALPKARAPVAAQATVVAGPERPRSPWQECVSAAVAGGGAGTGALKWFRCLGLSF